LKEGKIVRGLREKEGILKGVCWIVENAKSLAKRTRRDHKKRDLYRPIKITPLARAKKLEKDVERVPVYNLCFLTVVYKKKVKREKNNAGIGLAQEI